MKELPRSLHEAIKRLSAEGDQLAEQERYTEAFRKYKAALELVPEPHSEWETATWILAAIGDVYFLSGAYEQTIEAMSDAGTCPGGLGNPFIHLRLGQAAFELDQVDRAADELARAYMGAGKDIFDGDDPRYFEFLKTRIRPPADGKW